MTEAAVGFVGQDEAVEVLEAALKGGTRAILVLGAAGTGKTTYLRDLEARGVGAYVADPSAAASTPPEQRLLLDLDAAQDPSALLQAAGERVVIAACRGEPQPSEWALQGDEGELPVFSSEELVSATGGRLPLGLAERVQVVAPFRALSTAELEEIARRLLGRRASELDLSDELVSALASKAAGSPRQGHELRALVDRIPPGSWSMKPGVAAKRRKPKKKAKE